MIPKIEFRFSDVYDRRYRESKFIQEYLKKKKQTYPSREEILKYMKKAEKIWKEDYKKILKEISKISGLKWKEKRIICYVIGVGRPFSDPLTIRTYGKNVKKFVETLTHEMIHQIQIQNHNLFMKWWKYVLEKYKKYSMITKMHILLSAIHWKLLEKLEDKKAVKKEIKKYDKEIDYKQSWEIVQEETPEKIIKKFKRTINK